MTIYKTTDACCDELYHCYELQTKLQRSFHLAAKMSQLSEEQLRFIADEVTYRYGLCDAYYMSFSIDFIGRQAIVHQLALSFIRDIANGVSPDSRYNYWSTTANDSFELDHCIHDCFETFLTITNDFFADAISCGSSELEWQYALYQDVVKLTEVLEALTA